MLLKIYCSSFSTVTACTFDWLTDGRFLMKTKLNRLINSVCFRVRSITKKVKHGNYINYSVKVHSDSLRCIKGIWKTQYKFADAKINWLTWWYSSKFTRNCNLSILYRKTVAYLRGCLGCGRTPVRMLSALFSNVKCPSLSFIPL